MGAPEELTNEDKDSTSIADCFRPTKTEANKALVTRVLR